MRRHFIFAGLGFLLFVLPALAQENKGAPAAPHGKRDQPAGHIDAQKIDFDLWPMGAERGGGSWGLSCQLYAKFNKDGTVDRQYQGSLIGESITKQWWQMNLSMFPVTGEIAGEVASSYTRAEIELSDDKKIMTQRLTVAIQKKLVASLKASLREKRLFLLEEGRNEGVSFDVELKMRAGQYSVDALLPSGERLGTAGWKTKGGFANTARLSKGAGRTIPALGSAKCWGNLSTRKLPE
jgi:hypothetical protein